MKCPQCGGEDWSAVDICPGCLRQTVGPVTMRIHSCAPEVLKTWEAAHTGCVAKLIQTQLDLDSATSHCEKFSKALLDADELHLADEQTIRNMNLQLGEAMALLRESRRYPGAEWAHRTDVFLAKSEKPLCDHAYSKLFGKMVCEKCDKEQEPRSAYTPNLDYPGKPVTEKPIEGT